MDKVRDNKTELGLAQIGVKIK